MGQSVTSVAWLSGFLQEPSQLLRYFDSITKEVLGVVSVRMRRGRSMLGQLNL